MTVSLQGIDAQGSQSAFSATSSATTTTTTTETAPPLNLRIAKRLYERLTGVKVPSDKPELIQVAERLEKGQAKEAAELITSQPEFINVQIRNLGLRLSNRTESSSVAFNDFAAHIMGVVRDGKDFRDILTSDYNYVVAPGADTRTRLLNQSQFTAVDAPLADIKSLLSLNPKQQLIHEIPMRMEPTVLPMLVDEHPDPAGVLTSYSFGATNLAGGTNRKAIDFSLNQFLCVSLAEIADSTASDLYVGKDVDRFPAGDHNKYLTNCKSCHSIMDGMRPAFAKLNFGDTRYTPYVGAGGSTMMHGGFYSQHDIGTKFNDFFNVFKPTIASVENDLHVNQEKSEYYALWANYQRSLGKTESEVQTIMNNFIGTIRDPAVLDELKSEYRAKFPAVLADIRANRMAQTYITTYSKTCLDKFGTQEPAETQELAFLHCNIDEMKKTSLLYNYYVGKLREEGKPESEVTALSNKLINLNKPDIRFDYFKIKETGVGYPQNYYGTGGVATKMNLGTYPYGVTITTDTFVNNAVNGNREKFFGWRGPNRSGGEGTKDFGRMIADSRRFSQCMGKRVFESICQRKIQSSDQDMLARLGDQFEKTGYNMQEFYRQVAIGRDCGILGATE